MKFWPVPNCYSKNLPKSGPGSFAENRSDRHHCGVDIYAPKGSDVISIDSGKVLAKGVFSSPDVKPYWYTTYFVAIKNKTGKIAKYCELEDILVTDGSNVEAGQIIGHVGNILNFNNIDQNSPLYIQKIKDAGIKSMLHFELYAKEPFVLENYSGGNWFDKIKPSNLLDPTEYLLSLIPC